MSLINLRANEYYYFQEETFQLFRPSVCPHLWCGLTDGRAGGRNQIFLAMGLHY